MKHELDVREVFEPDEIIWDNLMEHSHTSVKNKIIMSVCTVITVGLTTILQVLIESTKTQFEMNNPPLMCPDRNISIDKELAYMD